jgi:hypothetical protein
VLCPSCQDAVLFRNIVDTTVFDLTFRCVGCGSDCDAPPLPPGRGLALHGATHAIDSGVFPVEETKILEYDDVVIGRPGVMRRRVETGRAFDAPTTQQMELNEPTLEGILLRARGVFAQLLPKLEGAFAKGDRRHRLSDLLARVEGNLAEVRAGGRTIDVLAWVEFERIVYQFERWSRDPVWEALLRESATPENFEHNLQLLTLATQLDNAELGPELVAPERGRRRPDLRFRLTARFALDADVKAPVTLQRRPDVAVPVKEARRVIFDAIKKSIGQFTSPSLLVVGGSFWAGDFDELAQAAADELAAPVPVSASAEVRAQRERLICGIVLLSRHIQVRAIEHDGVGEPKPGWISDIAFRWVRNPAYNGPFQIDFADDLSAFNFAFHPDAVVEVLASQDTPGA